MKSSGNLALIPCPMIQEASLEISRRGSALLLDHRFSSRYAPSLRLDPHRDLAGICRLICGALVLVFGWVGLAGEPPIQPVKEKVRLEILEAGKPGPFPQILWQKRIILDSPHYHIEANCPEKTVKYVWTLMEQLYLFYGQRMRLSPNKRLNLFIFGTREDFEEQAMLAGIYISPGVGGFYYPTTEPKKAGIWLPWINQGEKKDVTPTLVLMHEGWHQFYHAAFNTGEPIWLNEGMACYFEACRFDGEKISDGYINPRLEDLQKIIQENQALGPKKLMRVPHFAFDAEHYAEAWSLVYFLAWGQPGKAKNDERQNRFAFFMQNMRQMNNRTPEFFEKAMGVPFADLETEWKAFVLALDPKDPFGGKGDPRQKK